MRGAECGEIRGDAPGSEGAYPRHDEFPMSKARHVMKVIDFP